MKKFILTLISVLICIIALSQTSYIPSNRPFTINGDYYTTYDSLVVSIKSDTIIFDNDTIKIDGLIRKYSIFDRKSFYLSGNSNKGYSYMFNFYQTRDGLYDFLANYDGYICSGRLIKR